jgi:hypothetical protein
MTENFNKYEKYFINLILIILAYGYICRWFDIYFFWESKIIAVPILLLMMFYISAKTFIKEREFLSSAFLWIIICLFGFYQMYNEFNLNEEVLNKSKNFILNNKTIESEIGKIESIDFPVNNRNLSGSDYSIKFVVKGEKKYADIILNSYYQDRNLKNIDNLKIVSFEINDNYNSVE